MFSIFYSTSASNSLDQLCMDINQTIQLVISLTTISNGSLFTNFTDSYPLASQLLSDCYFMEIFGNIQYDLFLTFTNDILYAVSEYSEYANQEYVASNFTEEYNKYADKYLHAGVCRQCVEDAFIDSQEYPGDVDTVEFQAFIDHVHDSSYPEDIFYELFTSIYEDTHSLVMDHATFVSQTTDLTELGTDYMR